jgi:hypothetical protein
MAANPRDLITLARAYQNLQGILGIDTLLQILLTAASDAVQKYCKRDFVSTAYDELYSGSGDRRLLFRQYPIISVQSVRCRPVTVIKITNTLPANVQARVSVTSTGLTLVRVNAGVKTTDTSITFAGNITITAIAAAVNALGNGWSAQIVGDATNYGSFGGPTWIGSAPRQRYNASAKCSRTLAATLILIRPGARRATQTGRALLQKKMKPAAGGSCWLSRMSQGTG